MEAPRLRDTRRIESKTNTYATHAGSPIYGSGSVAAARHAARTIAFALRREACRARARALRAVARAWPARLRAAALRDRCRACAQRARHLPRGQPRRMAR